MKVKIEKMSSQGDDEKVESEDGESGGGEYEEYELEECAKTLLDAEKIKADPKKMAALKPHLQKLAKATEGIKSLADLREVAKKKMATEY